MFSVFFPNKISMESVKAEERRAAGRRFGPEAVTEQAAGLIWETHTRHQPIRFPLPVDAIHGQSRFTSPALRLPIERATSRDRFRMSSVRHGPA